MTFKIFHKTTYRYKYPVSVGNHVACLTPRHLPHHRCIEHVLRIKPTPTSLTQRTDYFGNQLTFFTVHEPHKVLIVQAQSEVSLDQQDRALPVESMPWEDVVRSLPRHRDTVSLDAYQFVFESPRIRPSSQLASYAVRSFTPGRPFIDALIDLNSRIFRDFRFDAKATNVRTSPEEVFQKKRGVCQDFAHLEIACLRSLNLAARYVSGYLRTQPPPGRPRLFGADASHAWVSAYCPGVGWFDVDPTNNVVPSKNHITIGWARDYGDVSPLRGLILGGRQHTLKVAVNVEAMED